MRWLAAGLAGAGLSTAIEGRAAQEILNGVAAIVDDAVITADDVNQLSKAPLDSARRQSRNEEEFMRRRAEIWRESLDYLIERELILHDFKTAGYNLPETFIDDQVNAEVTRVYGDRITLIKTLHEHNQTFESYRKQIRDSIIETEMTIKNVNEYIVISPKKIEEYYQQNLVKFQVGDRAKIRVVVVEKARRGATEAARIAADARARAAKGEDFAVIADQVSDDARRNKGGDRGWVENKESDLREELRKYVFAAKPGEVSPVIETDGADFIVKVEQRETAHLRPLSEARLEIERTLKARENERLRKRWIAKLRVKALIKYF